MVKWTKDESYKTSKKAGGDLFNIECLRVFCRVVQEGSITKDAKLGYVSQPAVTRQIAILKVAFGAALFDGEDGKLKKTEAEKILYPYAKKILAK